MAFWTGSREKKAINEMRLRILNESSLEFLHCKSAQFYLNEKVL